ncbi:hypothetical protein MKX01_021125 [Papaver californicum]|nr:hypothetical protein MKX01_021125 [Papaver californicum]
MSAALNVKSEFMVHFEVEDPIGCTVFVALDAEVQRLVGKTATHLLGTPEKIATAGGSFRVLNRPVTFQLALCPFQRIQKVATNFAVTCIYLSAVDADLGTN